MTLSFGRFYVYWAIWPDFDIGLTAQWQTMTRDSYLPYEVLVTKNMVRSTSKGPKRWLLCTFQKMRGLSLM